MGHITVSFTQDLAPRSFFPLCLFLLVTLHFVLTFISPLPRFIYVFIYLHICFVCILPLAVSLSYFFSSSLTSNKISSSFDFFPHSLLFCLPLKLCLPLGHCSAFIFDKAVQYVCFHTKNVPVLWLLLFFKFFLSQLGCHR